MKRAGDVKSESFSSHIIRSKSTIVLFVFYLIVINAFLYMLDAKTGAGFGFKEIIFALVIAVLLALVFAWITTVMRKNTHLGFISGLVTVVLLVSALFIKFKGTYTTMFAAIGTLGTVGYLMYHFFLYREGDRSVR